MLRVSDSGRTRWFRTVPIVAILAVMVMAAFPAAGASSIPTAATPLGGHATASLPPHTAAKSVATSPSSSSIHGASSSSYSLSRPSFSPSAANLSFYQNTSSFSQTPANEAGCTSYNYGYEIANTCNSQAYDPSAVTLANGDIGVGYTVNSNVTGTSTSSCVTGPTNTTVQERIGWAVSSDNGTSFGPVSFLGNETCSYLDAIEPSFAVGPTGTVYGVYVEENFSGQTGLYTDNYTYTSYNCYYGYITCQNRSADALGFTVSTDNGTTFSAPITISTVGWIAHPQIVVHGNSLYILYENINNASSGITLSYGYTYYTGWPISLELLNSSNGGATWSGPHGVPGIVGTSGVAQEVGPGIAVNATGTVAISYFTNDHCGATYYGYCEAEVDDLVLATTTTNGSSFKGPFGIAPNWGSTYPYWAPYYDYNYGSNFEEQPSSALAFSPDGATVYIGWTAPYNQSALFGGYYYPYELYQGTSGAFEATGSVKGTGFATNILMATSETYNDQFAYSLAIGATSSGVYVTYSGFNESYCYYGNTCSYLGGAFFEVIQTSPDGHSWSGQQFPTFVQTGGSTYNLGQDYPGIYSSVAFTTAGAPVYVYSLPNQESYSYNFNVYPYYYNTTYPTDLYVATAYSGPTVSLNISESGLIAGTPWSISINGALVDVPGGVTNFTLSGVPVGETILFSVNQLNVVYLEIALPSFTISGGTAFEGAASFTGNGTVQVQYTYEFGVNFLYQPANPLDIDIESVPCCSYDFYVDNFCFPTACTGGYPSAPPWYLPAGTSIEFYGYGDPVAAQFWTGTGNGSYTGPGSYINLTVNGPINETAWFVPLGEYNVTVQAPTLPPSSTYSFSFDNVQYFGSGGSPVTVPNVETGAHYFSNVSATATTAGWTYVGTSADYQPELVPNSLVFNLSFALIDTAAPAGTVTFEAQGFTAGTPWQFSFNSTSYSSTTPWINVTTHPGTFLTSASPAVASNGSVGYVPLGVPSAWSVTTGSVYLVNYTQAYRVTAIAGSGGSLSGGGIGGVQWVLSGALVSLQESAHSGYQFNGWTGTGIGSYTGNSPWANITVGGPVTETASFVPLPGDRFNMTFQESGLAAGTLWTAFVGGIGYSGTSSTIVVQNLLACGAPGANYNISIPTVYASNHQTRYVGTSSIPKTQCTTGSTLIKETFAPQYYVSVQATPGGYATATVGSTSTTTGFWVASGATVGLDAYVQPGYDFLGWNGSGPGNYTGTLQIDTIVIAGPVLEVAAFAIPVSPPPTVYWITFSLTTPLSSGTAWTVTVQGTGYTSTGSSLTVSGLSPGTYQLSYPTAYSPDGMTKYTSAGAPSSVSLSANRTIPIGYTTAYWVSVTAGVGGTIVTPNPASGWVASGATVTLNATPNSGYDFVGWSGTGASSYTGPSSTDVLQVRSPVTEVASFELPPTTPGGTTTTSTSFFAQPIAWIGLGILGLLVGLVVGVLVTRRGRSPPPAAAAPVDAGTAPGGSDTTYGMDGSGGSS